MTQISEEYSAIHLLLNLLRRWPLPCWIGCILWQTNWSCGKDNCPASPWLTLLNFILRENWCWLSKTKEIMSKILSPWLHLLWELFTFRIPHCTFGPWSITSVVFNYIFKTDSNKLIHNWRRMSGPLSLPSLLSLSLHLSQSLIVSFSVWTSVCSPHLLSKE